jgi:hypothetical protein
LLARNGFDPGVCRTLAATVSTENEEAGMDDLS